MKKISTFLLLLFLAITGFAQNEQPFTVQGVPYPYANGQQVQATVQPALQPSAEAFTFDDITFWVGEGSHKSAMIVQWNEEGETKVFVWGYRWTGDAVTGEKMIADIAAADPRFYYIAQTGTQYGTAIGGFGYDVNNSGNNQLKNPSDETVDVSETGMVDTGAGYGFDGWKKVDTEDFWASGWMSGYWSYWVKTTSTDDWGYSQTGATGRVLTDGCWDGWNFSKNMQSYDWKELVPAATPYLFEKKNYSVLGDSQDTVKIDLASYLSEAVSAQIENKDEALLSAVLEGTILKVTNVANQTGVGSIVVKLIRNNVVVSETITVTVNPADYYLQGAYVLNEDWFGHDNGTMNFLNSEGNCEYRVFRAKNAGAQLGTTSQFATSYGDYIYVMSKQASTGNNAGGRMIILNKKTLKLVKSITELGADGRSFVGVNPTKGYVGTGNGVYQFDITNLTVGDLVAGTDNGEVGLMIATGNYLFVAQSRGVYVINTTSNELVETIAGTVSSIAQSANGMIWAAAEKELIKINPATLEHSRVALKDNCPIGKSWGFWNAGSFLADPKENVLYWAKGGGWSGSTELYRYKIGDASSLDQPFFTIPMTGEDKYIFYGAGVRLNSRTNEFIITAKKDGWGANSEKNQVLIVDKKTAEVKKTVQLEDYYWFPAMPFVVDMDAPKFVDLEERYNIIGNNADTVVIDLTNKLVDLDNNNLNITISVTTDSELLSVTRTGKLLKITNKGEALGEGKITITAESNGVVTSKDITVILNSKDYYLEGTYILNEDWFGHDNSSLNFINAAGDCEYRVYQAKNKDSEFGVTSQFATYYGDNIYVMSKQASSGNKAGGRLIVLNKRTLKTVASFETIGGGDGRSFVGVNPTKGYIAASNGVYLFDIEKMEVGAVVEGTGGGSAYSGQIGLMLASGNYVFANSQKDGVYVIDATTDKLVKTIAGTISSLAQTPDGTIWAAAGTQLIKIDPQTLETTTVDLPTTAKIGSSWGAWNAGSFIADPKENVLYWAKAGSMFGSTGILYRYDVNNPSSLDNPFYTLPAVDGDNYVFYGAGVRLDSRNNQLVLTAKKDGWGANSLKNTIYYLDKTTAEVKRTVNLKEHYWFPAMPLIPDNNAPKFTDVKERYNIIGNNNDTVKIDLKTVLTDLDNLNCNINVKATSSSDLLSITTENKVLKITNKGKDLGEGVVTITAESNGVVVTKEITVALNTKDYYLEGTYVLNEDWFGHDNGTMNFINTKGDAEYRIYRSKNPGSQLGATSCYATSFGDYIYVMSKQTSTENTAGGRLIVLNKETLKTVKSIAELGADGRSFVGVNPTKGYIGTSNGVYQFDIANLTVGDLVAGTDNGEIGLMIATGNYLFVAQSAGVYVINTTTNELVETIAGTVSSIAQTADGTVWAAAGKELIKINPTTLEHSTVALNDNCPIGNSWGFWHAGSFFADPNENVLYWSKDGGWSGSTELYRYKIGDASSLDQPFFTIPLTGEDKYIFNGAGVRLNSRTNELVITAKKDGWGENSKKNQVLFVDKNTAEVKKTVQLEDYYWYPTMPLILDTKAPVFEVTDTYDLLTNISDPVIIDLKETLNDIDNNNYNITVSIENSNEALASTTLENKVLTITPKENQSGSAVITITVVSNGVVTTKAIQVNVAVVPVESLTLDKSTATLRYTLTEGTTLDNNTLQLVATLNPEVASFGELEWSSTDESIATVDANGLVVATGKKNGVVTITVSTEDGQFTATCNLFVTQFVSEMTTSIEQVTASLSRRTLVVNQAKGKTIALYTMRGTSVLNEVVASNQATYSVDLSAKVYILVITDKTERRTCKLIVK